MGKQTEFLKNIAHPTKEQYGTLHLGELAAEVARLEKAYGILKAQLSKKYGPYCVGCDEISMRCKQPTKCGDCTALAEAERVREGK
jgi:hypothetical protein